MRVLIADDDPIIRLDLKQMLENMEYLVVAEAGDGREAVDLAREHKPDICILDVKMPVMDGHDARAQLKADKAEGKMAAESKDAEKVYKDKQAVKGMKKDIETDKANLKADEKK